MVSIHLKEMTNNRTRKNKFRTKEYGMYFIPNII